MDDQNLKDQQREAADNKMIEDAFNEVLKIYLASQIPHLERMTTRSSMSSC